MPRKKPFVRKVGRVDVEITLPHQPSRRLKADLNDGGLNGIRVKNENGKTIVSGSIKEGNMYDLTERVQEERAEVNIFEHRRYF